MLKQLHKLHCIANKQPHFQIDTGQIQILKEPIDFYVHLHKGIRSSTKRIIWSSLYLGEGNLEQFLIDSLSRQLRHYDQMKASILLDYYRACRIDNTTSSSAKHTLHCLRMANLFSHQLKLGLLRHPKLPAIFDQFNTGGFREIFNVHHMKWYIFDDSVILSGANLSQSYFTDRQDRYIILHEVPEIADYLDDAQSALMQHAYQIDDAESIVFDSNRAIPTKRKQYFNEFLQTWKIFQFSHQNQQLDQNYDEDVHQNTDTTTTTETTAGETTTTAQATDIEEIFSTDVQLATQMQERKEQAAKMYLKLFFQFQSLQENFNVGDVQNILNKIESTLYKQSETLQDNGEDAFIFITLQVPYLQTTEETNLLQCLLEQLKSQAKSIWIASGYMNFGSQLASFLKKSEPLPISLLTASPQANGFYQAEIFEYNRQGWTFHAKGIWADLGESFVTVIGSSNFSERSSKRDNEVQFYIYSKCPKLKEEFFNEKNRLFEKSKRTTLKDIQTDPKVKLTWKKQLLATIFKSFL